MILYNRKVNYSVFDGEITLSKEAKEHLLDTIFLKNSVNRDIQLIIDWKNMRHD